MTPQFSGSLDKGLPHSEEAERCVLGGIILDNALLAQVEDILHPDDFYSQLHQRFYRAMVSLASAGKPIEPALLVEEVKMQARGQEIYMPNFSHITMLTHGLPHFTDIRGYANLVKGKSTAREIVRRCNEVAQLALAEQTPIDEICGYAQEHLRPILESSEGSFSDLKPFKIVRMSEVEDQDIEWLWEPFLALGTFNLVEGEEEAGKTTLFCALASAIGWGRGLPEVAPGSHIPPSNVLFISAEDSLAKVLKKRLEAAKAPCERVLALDEPFTLDREGILRLSLAMAKYEPKLVVIDPLFSYTGRINLNNDNEIRSITDALKRLAEKHNCAIVGIRHIGKTKGFGDARNAGLNGIGWRAAARSVLLIGRNPEREEQRALCQTKNNLAAKYEGSLGFELRDGQFFWTGRSDLTSATMLSYKQSESVDERSAKSEAIRFLEEMLKDGPLGSKIIYDAGTQAGIAPRTIQRAKKGLNVISKKDSGVAGGWSWALPPVEKSNIAKEDRQAIEAGNVGEVGELIPQNPNIANKDRQIKEVGELTLNNENKSIYTHILPKDRQDRKPTPTEAKLATLLHSSRKML